MINKFFFIVLFLLRKHNRNSKYYILLLYYLILIFGLFCRGNGLNKKKSPKYVNKLWIQYYYYDTIYYLYNIIFKNSLDNYHIEKIIHHLITLSFFLRKRYNCYAINLIHGNIILSTVPLHLSIISNKFSNSEKECPSLISDFPYIYSNIFFVFLFDLAYKYNIDKKTRIEIRNNTKKTKIRMDYWFLSVISYGYYLSFKKDKYISSVSFSLVVFYLILLKKKKKLDKFLITTI